MYEKSLRQACAYFVSTSRQKKRKNSKTNETRRKGKISHVQSLSSQLLIIKQVRKTAGQESLLPSPNLPQLTKLFNLTF
jgi:hypothetical protein